MEAVILEDLGISPEELAELKRPLELRGVTFRDYPRTEDGEALIREVGEAEAVILANMPLPAHVIEGCERLRFIDVAFTGVDHVAIEAARSRGIAVSNASGYSDEAVAELAVGMALSLLRNLRKAEDRCRSGGTKAGLVGSEIRGKTVGILGLGRIGARSARLFHAFGARILAHSRTFHRDAPDFVEQVTLEELLRRSDILVLHCPLNDSTRGLIDREKLKMMKSTAILINVARGPVVVSEDLAGALNDGVIAGAAVDVFDSEPPLQSAEPLLHAENTLLTPHVAYATRESMSLRAKIVFENLSAWLDGEQINKVI